MSHRATVGGCALGLGVGWNVSNIGAVAEPLSGEYGVSLTTVGLFTTALFVTHALLQVPAGRSVDRLGARRVGLVALAVLLVANASALAAPDPSLALTMRAVAGVGTALGFLAGIDYVRAQGGSSFAQGMYGGLALGAGGVALAVVPQVEDWIGWRAPWASAIVVGLLGAAILAAGPRDVLRPAVSHGHAHAAGGDVPVLVRDPRLYRLCVVYMASFGLAVVLGNWVVTLLERAGGYSNSAAGAIGSVVLLAGIVSRPLGGWVVRRYPSHVRRSLALSLVIAACGTLILSVAGSPGVSIVGGLLLGLAAGVPFTAALGAAARVRPEAPAAAIALVNMSANLLIVAGTPLLGLSFSLPGDGRIGFYVATALWLGALAMLPAVRELDAVPRASPSRA